MAIRLGDSNSLYNAGPTGAGGSIALGPSAGSAITVLCWGTASTFSPTVDLTCTDNKGNSYSLLTSNFITPGSQSMGLALFGAYNVAGGTTTITCKWGSSVGQSRLLFEAQEWQGCANTSSPFTGTANNSTFSPGSTSLSLTNSSCGMVMGMSCGIAFDTQVINYAGSSGSTVGWTQGVQGRYVPNYGYDDNYINEQYFVGPTLANLTMNWTWTVSPGDGINVLSLGTGLLVNPNATVTPSGVHASFAVNSPTISAGSAVSPSGVTFASAVHSPTIVAGSTVSPAGVTSAFAVGTPTTTVTANVTVTPAGVTSNFAVGTPTISAGVTVSPSGVAFASAVGTPVAFTTVILPPSGMQWGRGF